MKKTILAAALIVLAAACQRESATATQASREAIAPPPAEIVHPVQSATAAPAPAAETAEPAAHPVSLASASATILDPQQFVDPRVRAAYAKAQDIPERIDKLFCYCYCSKNEKLKHKSLLSCYQGTHAAECEICMREVEQAWSDWKAGIPVETTKASIDLAYGDGTPHHAHEDDMKSMRNE